MSVETFSPLPLVTFGTWTTLLDPSEVPPGMSPSAADVEFFPGGVRTRPGLLSMYSPLGGLPAVNGLKTYITTNLVQRLLVLDSSGNLWKETSSGVLSSLATILTQGLFCNPRRNSAASTWRFPTARSAKTCRANSTT